MEILAQSSTAFVLTHNFQGTHILGASRGYLSDSVASCFKPGTENNANFGSVSSKRSTFDDVLFSKHIAKHIIIGTHNLQTFKHNTLINDYC